MFLIVGLGNPGKEYEHTRHNAGREAVRAWTEKSGFSFHENKKLQALVVEGNLEGEKITFILPQTYMNNSGVSVQAIAAFYKLLPNAVLVVHDDVDLPLGTLQLARGRGAGGHHGVESVIAALGTKDFVRLRIGIGRADEKKIDTEKFVLEHWTEDENEKVANVMVQASECLSVIVRDGLEKAMHVYNTLQKSA